MTMSYTQREKHKLCWHKDRQALFRYRLASAYYGLRLRLTRPYSDVLGIIALLLTILGLALTIQSVDLRIYGEALGAVIVVTAWPVIRYLGAISTLMRAAASTEEGTRRLFDDMREGMGNSRAYGQLCRIYKPLIDEANSDLESRGWPCRLELVEIPRKDVSKPPNEYACVILRTSGLANLANLLGYLRKDPPYTRRSERRAENRQRLMRRWRSLHPQEGIGDEEGRNYCLAEIRFEREPPRLALDLGVVRYGQIARTCEALVNEFAVFAFITKGGKELVGDRHYSQFMRPSTVLHCLPWRRNTHQSAGSAAALFVQPYNRAAGVGVAVATIVSRAGRRKIYVGERSETVGTYPNVLHVIPGGNCNTHGSQRQIEHMERAHLPNWYLRSVMRCEYLEEWFNDDNLEKLRIPDWRARVDQLWAERVTEARPLELTGLAFDLLNLRPEVCAKLEVKMRGNEMLNWEYSSGLPPEEWALSDIGEIDRTRIVQSAAAALLLARSKKGTMA
jgi:hypothetical protein